MRWFFLIFWVKLLAVDHQYLPVFKDLGFSESGGYFDAGFQATVNHIGGNLILTADDVALPDPVF